MVEPISEKDLVNVIRDVIRFVQSEEEPLTLDWPDDFDGQARCIRCLADIAITPECLYEYRVWAFDYLKEIASEYHKSGVLDSVPPEMVSWCLSVVSGAVKRPKRSRGRPGRYSLREQKRNRAIVASVAYLIGEGKKLPEAMHLVGDAAGLSDERVDSIISQTSVDRAMGTYVPESVMRILLDGHNE